ncbi:branched-chain amino acid ABC transporter permease [Pigmentiphaga soli]|uniref:Branched-chain amino acid ABC transporter permease n=1 Tax=Pigmentiphaga soli TaxID=1007095 RepID=A0ABP8GUY8_9BURK
MDRSVFARNLAPAAALFAALAATPWAADDYGLSFATGLLIWIALAESWVILSGYAGYVSLGHAAFVGIGAYAVVLTWGVLPFWLGLLLGGAAGAALAAVVGIPCLRVRGPYFVILTLAVSEFVKYVVVNIEARLGSFGRLLMGQPEALTLFHTAWLLALLAFLGAWGIRRSRLGIGLRAIRENEIAAEMTGVRVGLLKSVAYVLSAIAPALAGGLMVARTGYFEPATIFSPQISLTIIAMCAAGGSDGPWGPLLGALLLTILSELLRDAAPQLYLIILGMLLVFFTLKMPGGLSAWLAGAGTRLRTWWRARRPARARLPRSHRRVAR